MEVTYYPAVMPGLPPSSNRVFKNWDLNFWSDKGFFKHNFMLISAYFGMKFPNIKEEFKMKNIKLMGDSGGFQNYSLGLSHLQQKDVIEWQNNNCDLAFILDYPPYQITENGILTLNNDDFKTCMLKTFENANIAYNLKKKNLLLYNVLQGNNRERMQEWFNKMNEIPLDGWSVALKKPTDNNPLTLAQTLLFLKENGVKKNVHLLAISGKTLTPLLFYFKEYIKNLTFDSSSYINKKLPTSYFLRDNKNLLLFGQSLNHKLTKIPCDCGVCKNIEINDLKLDDGPTIVSLIALHNLRVMLDEYNILDSLVSDKDIFKQYIKSKKMEETYIALEFIDYGLENGLKKAEHKFEQYLNKRIITKEQSTLFKF